MTHYADKKDLFPMRGGCACGLIRYELALPPMLVHCCHCTRCQRETGSAFVLNAVCATSDITLRQPDSSNSGLDVGVSPAAHKFMTAFAKINGGIVAASKNDNVTQPVLITVPSDSTIGVSQAQCPSCHTTLWSHYADAGPHLSYLRAGTLDTAAAVEPDVHIYTRSARSFISISDGKPQFEEYYPNRKALLREDALDRLGKFEPKLAEYRAQLGALLKGTA